jgi:hypothetical protein
MQFTVDNRAGPRFIAAVFLASLQPSSAIEMLRCLCFSL